MSDETIDTQEKHVMLLLPEGDGGFLDTGEQPKEWEFLGRQPQLKEVATHAYDMRLRLKESFQQNAGVKATVNALLMHGQGFDAIRSEDGNGYLLQVAGKMAHDYFEQSLAKYFDVRAKGEPDYVFATERSLPLTWKEKPLAPATLSFALPPTVH